MNTSGGIVDSDMLLGQVACEVEAVRRESFQLLKLIESFNSRQGGVPGEKSGIAGLNALKEHEQYTKGLLWSLQNNTNLLDQRELSAVSGSGSNNTSNNSYQQQQQGYYEDADASRTIATKGVGRELAHSLYGEIAWRKASFESAKNVDSYFRRKILLQFPQVKLKPSKRSSGAGKHKSQTDENAEIQQLLDTFQGVVSHSINMNEGDNGDVTEITCQWKIGLACKLLLSQTTSYDRPRSRRVAWVEIYVQDHDLSSDKSNSHASSVSLAHELTVAAQQLLFKVSKSYSTSETVQKLLVWVDQQFFKLSHSNVRSGIASSLHLELEK